MMHFIIIVFIETNLFSAFSDHFYGARPTALAGAFVSLADDINSIYYNPAGLSRISRLSLSGTWLRYYHMEELENVVISFGAPWRWGGWGISYQAYGFNLYKETQVIWSHAFSILSQFQVGYNIKYLNLALHPDPHIVSSITYGDANLLGLDMGMKGKINRSLFLGAYLMNINRPKIGIYQPEGVEQKFTFGIGYQPVPKIITLFSLDKNSFEQYKVKTGAELLITQFLSLRTGMQMKPFYFSFGVGVKRYGINLDYALVHSLLLGETHILSLIFTWGKEYQRENEKSYRNNNYLGLKVNINRATIKELKELPGIGLKTAEKIYNYRKEKGLFNSIEDIKEVEGISEDKYNQIKDIIIVDEKLKEVIKPQFNIQTAELKDFIEIGIPAVKAIRIIRYRETKGQIKKWEELKKVEGLTDEDLKKLSPFIEKE